MRKYTAVLRASNHRSMTPYIPSLTQYAMCSLIKVRFAHTRSNAHHAFAERLADDLTTGVRRPGDALHRANA
jgi:hypothetical protein